MSRTAKALYPFLLFDGNCREAMDFYADLLDGEVEYHTFEGLPGGAPEGAENNIMHATLRAEELTLLASDRMPGDSSPVVTGNTVTLSLYASGFESGEEIFARLSADGGTVMMPYTSAFWGGHFGMLTDRYGIQWMVSCEETT